MNCKNCGHNVILFDEKCWHIRYDGGDFGGFDVNCYNLTEDKNHCSCKNPEPDWEKIREAIEGKGYLGEAKHLTEKYGIFSWEDSSMQKENGQ